MNPSWRWVRLLHRRWVFWFEPLAFALLLLAFGAKTMRVWAGGPWKWELLLVSGAALTWLVHYLLLFNAIRCDECGYNPTRFSNGRKKTLSKVYRELAPLAVCPACEARAIGKELFNS